MHPCSTLSLDTLLGSETLFSASKIPWASVRLGHEQFDVGHTGLASFRLMMAASPRPVVKVSYTSVSDLIECCNVISSLFSLPTEFDI